MRPRTPTIIWIPFVFSIASLSWILLAGAMVIFAAVILVPAREEIRQAEIQRNDVQATIDLLDQKLALQDDFIKAAGNDPLVLERLASRQFRLTRADQQVLPGFGATEGKDQSVRTMLAESLKPVQAARPDELPDAVKPVLQPPIRSFLVVLASVAMGLGFLLGVRYERPVHAAAR